MKRVFYVSRFSRPLTERDLDAIRESSVRNNLDLKVTGFLVCLGNTFFQVLEGPAESVDHLYYQRIVPDGRHKEILCLKTENNVKERMFPNWHMKTFNLNDDAETLPLAFREMLSSLLESHHTISQYTQPSILRMVEEGINPVLIAPRQERVTVLYSDIIGFSRFAEHLAAADLIELVNSHAEVCTHFVSLHNGQVNKLTGDGVLAYFTGPVSNDAIDAAIGILIEMAQRRESAGEASHHRYLFGGVGLAHGLVYEGNVGSNLKRDFTILGNTVNLASRIESMTRDLDIRLNLDSSVVESATNSYPFQSLGTYRLKGQSKELELFTLLTFSPLKIGDVYRDIETFVNAESNE